MARDPSLRQRGNRRYSFADHGNTTTGQRQGKHVIKNNMADHWNPTYGDGVTTIRIFPQLSLDPASGQTWDPYRFSSDPRDFGDFMRMYPAVRNFGDPGVTFIMADPSDPTMEDPQMLPPWVLFNAIDRAVQNKQDQRGWAGLLRGGRGRGAQLPRPSEIYLVQCAIMQHKAQIYAPPKGFGPEDRLVMMELSSSAGNAFIGELDKVVEGSNAPEGDWEHQMVNGDPLALDNGRFVTFYKLADGDPRQRNQASAAGWNQQAQGGSFGNQGGGGAGQQEPIGYGCYLDPTFNGMPARLQEYEEVIAQKVKPWDEVLWFPTVEEQAHLIADKFPADAVMYAFRDRPEWIPDSIRNRAVAQTVVAPPDAGWGVGGAPAAEGQQGAGMPVGPPPQQQQPPAQAPTADAFQGGFPAPAGATMPVTQQAPPPQPLPQAAPPAAPAEGPTGGPPPAAGSWMASQNPAAGAAQAQLAPQAPPAQPPMQQVPQQAPPMQQVPQQVPQQAPPMQQVPQQAPPMQQVPQQAPPAQQAPQVPTPPAGGFAQPPGAPVTGQQMTRAQLALQSAQSAAGVTPPPPQQ